MFPPRGEVKYHSGTKKFILLYPHSQQPSKEKDTQSVVKSNWTLFEWEKASKKDMSENWIQLSLH